MSFAKSYYETTERRIRDVHGGVFTTERERVLNALKADVLDNIDTATSIECIEGHAECPDRDLLRIFVSLKGGDAKAAFGFDPYDAKVAVIFGILHRGTHESLSVRIQRLVK